MTAQAHAQEFEDQKQARLTNTLFGSLPDFYLGSLLSILIAALVGYHVENAWMNAVTAGLVVVTGWRSVVMIGYKRDPKHAENHVMWRRRFGLSTGVFAMFLGATAFLGITGTADQGVHLFAFVGVVGYVTAIAARNAGCPEVVAPQVLLSLLPAVAALVIHGGEIYYAAAGICFLHCFSCIFLSKKIRKIFDNMFAEEENAWDKTRNFQVVMTNMPRGFSIVDEDQLIHEWNGQIFSLLGIRREDVGDRFGIHDILEQSLASGRITREGYVDAIATLLRRNSDRDSLRLLTSERLYLELCRERTGDDRWTFSVEDVTEKELHEREIRQRATCDELTGLFNRIHCIESCEAEILAHVRSGRVGAYLAIDLDGFKGINDMHGHATGDALLREVGGILSASVRDRDIVGRMGGDEFAIFLPDVSETTGVHQVANRIIDQISKNHEIEGRQVRVGASIGIAFVGCEHATSQKSANERADLALYSLKSERTRNSVAFFEPGMGDRARKKTEIEDGLRATLARGGDELTLNYQPIICNSSNDIIGCEALVRWNRPEGQVQPNDFIAIAEQSSLIVDLGEWVLRTACRTAATWDRPLRVAVNLSPIQMQIGDLIATVRKALTESGLEPHRLELEITEGVLAKDKAKVSALMQEIKAMGVRMALDDFGQGYSSLSYIRELPFDKIKVDRQFIDDIATNAMSQAILSSIVRIARAGGMSVTAEGIETDVHLDCIREIGVDQSQGYFFSRPLPASEFGEKWASLAIVERAQAVA